MDALLLRAAAPEMRGKAHLLIEARRSRARGEPHEMAAAGGIIALPPRPVQLAQGPVLRAPGRVEPARPAGAVALPEAARRRVRTALSGFPVGEALISKLVP